jgi:hypothetical protein
MIGRRARETEFGNGSAAIAVSKVQSAPVGVNQPRRNSETETSFPHFGCASLDIRVSTKGFRGTISDLNRYQQVINYVSGGGFARDLNNYDSVSL